MNEKIYLIKKVHNKKMHRRQKDAPMILTLYFKVSMEYINQKLSELGSLRKELIHGTSIWKLAKQIKMRAKPLDLKAKNETLSIESAPGLYYFEAKFNFQDFNKLEEFGNKWGVIRKTKEPKGVSRYYPERAKHHKKRLKRYGFIPFYLGKREDISNRIIGHLDGIKESGTYSLKLRSRPEIIKGITFRYSYINFDLENDSYFGVELLERELREIFNPIIGKQ